MNARPKPLRSPREAHREALVVCCGHRLCGRAPAQSPSISGADGPDDAAGKPSARIRASASEPATLRTALPKGTDLSMHNQAELGAIALHHNAKPRKSPGRKSAAELFLPPGLFDFQAYGATVINPDALGA